MGTIHVVAKADFLQSLSTSKPIAAIAELVWNGLDACATNVQVVIDPNELDGLEAIRVRDDGTGIKRRELDDLFGSLGDSWKSKVDRFEGRSLHGKNGKGRFKAFVAVKDFLDSGLMVTRFVRPRVSRGVRSTPVAPRQAA